MFNNSESLSRAVKHQTAVLAELIADSDGVAVETVAGRLNGLASAQGALAVHRQYEELVENIGVPSPGNAVRYYRWLASLGARDADDQWSGRGNDVRRAKRDGAIEAIREIRVAVESAVQIAQEQK